MILFNFCEKFLAEDVSSQQTISRKIRISARDTALTALFATLIAIIARLLGIPISWGLQYGEIEFSVPLYPLAGILLGPWIGALAVIIGNFIAWIIPKSTVFGLLLIPAGAFAALCAGFLTRRQSGRTGKVLPFCLQF